MQRHVKKAIVFTPQKLLRKVPDYSKGSKNLWSFVKKTIPHLTKVGQSFTNSVENAIILAEMFSKNSTLSDQPLPFTPRASCTISPIWEDKRVLANLV